MRGVLACLLLLPAMAAATSPPATIDLSLTSGTLTMSYGDGLSWSGSGPGFSARGDLIFGGPGPNGANFLLPGDTVNLTWGENADGGFFMGVALRNGESFDTQGPGGGFGDFAAGPFKITGAGTYTTGFGISGGIAGDPGVSLGGGGSGIVTVVPAGDGSFYVSRGTFSFGVPEPSSLGLFVLALAALALTTMRRAGLTNCRRAYG